MSKLYFRFGTMNSGKTLQLLSVAHNYESQGKQVCVIKPALDTRSEYVESRTGVKRKADIVISEQSPDIDVLLTETDIDNLYAVLVDEANFLTEQQVLSLTRIVDLYRIPVIAYGLKSDFRGKLFPGSKTLIELADKVEEIKTICHMDGCMTKASFNMRIVNGKPVSHGEQIVVGDITGDVRYKPVCRSCFRMQAGIPSDA